jgi:tetratricopeptide (TPR) repeat protein
MRQLGQSPEDARLLYRLALTRNELGKSEDAADLMRGLANFKRHEQAARWLLEKEYFGKDWGSLEADQKDEFGRLLALIHEQNPDDLSVKQLYADYLIASEKFTLAVPILDDLSRIQPMRGLQGAALLRKLGNNAAADRLAKRTLEAVAQLSEEDPTNSVLALAVAQNQLFLKRYTEAVGTLERAVRRAKTDEQRGKLSQAIGDAMVAWVSTLDEPPNKSVSDRLRMLKMLQVALEHAPNNPRVLTMVADQVLATMNEDDEQVRAVREALIQGSSVGIAHFIRGTAALMKDDIESAATSLKLAAEHMPHSGAILNNLAVALSVRDDSDLEQALKISESAIKQTKNPTPHFFETRGQILYRLGRYIDAIPDLERALAAKELAVGAHQALAECYAEIGEEELSRLHREAAGDLAEKSSPEEVADSSK